MRYDEYTFTAAVSSPTIPDRFTPTFNKKCVAATTTNCKTDVLKFPLSSAKDYACIACKSGFLPVVDLASANYVIFNANSLPRAFTAVNAAFTAVSTCAPVFTNIRGTTDLAGNVYNCQYY